MRFSFDTLCFLLLSIFFFSLVAFIAYLHLTDIQTRTVPKTTSGKIARSWCRRALLDGTLEIVQKWEGNLNEKDVQLLDEDENEIDTEDTVMDHEQLEKSRVPLETDLNKDRDDDEEATLVEPPSHSAEELRAMSLSALEQLLETKLFQVSSQGPAPLPLPIDRDTSFVAFGLDSMTVVQFKGVIENRYDDSSAKIS